MAKILIVDDEPGMRQVINRILGPKGHELLMAEDGAQALEVCGKEWPQLALVDIRLPDMDGAEILHGLRGIIPTLPVIILAGFGDTDTAAEMVKQGASDYISKPFKVEDLLNLVQKTLASYKEPPPRPQQPKPPVETVHPAREEPVPEAPVQAGSGQSRRRMSVRIGAMLGVVAAVIAAGFLAWRFYFGKTAPDAEYTIQNPNPAALCWDGRSVWTADWFTESIYRHNRDKTFSLSAAYKLPGIQPVGLAYDGVSLWSCSTFECKIYKHKLDDKLSVIAEFPSPGPSPSGLYYDGTYLWSLDFQQSKAYKHNLDATLSVAQAFDSPALHPRGMFAYKKAFFILDSENNRIAKVTPDTFSLLGMYTLPQFEKGTVHPVGMMWDGKSLWTCADGTPTIFRNSFKSLKPVKF